MGYPVKGHPLMWYFIYMVNFVDGSEDNSQRNEAELKDEQGAASR